MCLLLALWSGSTFAAEQNQCRTLKDERDSLASQAMAAEIALGKKYREKICPSLAKQAEQANANGRSSQFINYEALLDCRKKAETRLERENKVLYRNRLGFTFYTSKGAKFAKEADQLILDLATISCP